MDALPTDPYEYHQALAAIHQQRADECANPNSPKARIERAKADAHRAAAERGDPPR